MAQCKQSIVSMALLHLLHYVVFTKTVDTQTYKNLASWSLSKPCQPCSGSGMLSYAKHYADMQTDYLKQKGSACSGKLSCCPQVPQQGRLQPSLLLTGLVHCSLGLVHNMRLVYTA